MKISKITIKQLFGIKEWQGDGKNIELVGDNGTGKTSVIDAIRYALTNSSDREFIVKNGETEGEIYIETDNGLSIDRKARTAMTDYKSVKQNGNVIPSPESFLKTIFTPLQLSPMEFISMDKTSISSMVPYSICLFGHVLIKRHRALRRRYANVRRSHYPYPVSH